VAALPISTTMKLYRTQPPQQQHDTVSFPTRLSIRQQKELCQACAIGAHARGDILGEARALAHLGIGRDNLSADSAMARAAATVEQGLEANHPIHAAMLLSRAIMHIDAGRFQQVWTPPPPPPRSVFLF